MTVTIREERRIIITIDNEREGAAPEAAVVTPNQPSGAQEHYTPEERSQLWQLLPEPLREVLRVASTKPEGYDRSDLMKHFGESPGKYGSRFRSTSAIMAHFPNRPWPYKLAGHLCIVLPDFREFIANLPPDER